MIARMNFEFASAGRIIFGPGRAGEVAGISAGFGRRALVLAGSDPARISYLLDGLASPVIFSVVGEPTVKLVEKGAETARREGCDHVISIGGGSVIDAGKAIAALVSNGGSVLDYLEVIGKGKGLSEKSTSFIAVPTTAGTGSEVTRNAVLLSEEHKVKVSMRSSMMLPDVAVVDPLLTHSLPPAVTASTGLDALTQLIEGYVSIKASPLTDGICREGILAAVSSLLRAYENGDDAEAREKMSLASLFGGIVLANAGLGAVHGFAGPLGGMYGVPHGVICAVLLPHVMKANISALEEREPASPASGKYRELGRLLTGRVDASADDGVRWIECLCSALKIPSLAEFGLDEKDFPKVVSGAKSASSMKGNPAVLNDEELTGILHSAL